MLALTGAGYADGRTFGFASCERAVGATEGMNVLMEQRLPQPDGSGFEYSYNVANVEYTEFERLGITDETATDGAHSVLPANTNILYVSLKVSSSPSCQRHCQEAWSKDEDMPPRLLRSDLSRSAKL